MEILTYSIPVIGALALVYAFFLALKIKKQSPGNEKMQEISSAIHEGAKAFLFAEYRILVFFIIALFAAIGVAISCRLFRHECCNQGKRENSSGCRNKRNEKSPFRCLLRRCRYGYVRCRLRSFRNCNNLCNNKKCRYSFRFRRFLFLSLSASPFTLLYLISPCLGRHCATSLNIAWSPENLSKYATPVSLEFAPDLVLSGKIILHTAFRSG